MFRTERLAELDPATFGAMFLEKFAIPLYVPISWIVAVGEFFVIVGGGIDISVGKTAALAGVVGATLLEGGAGPLAVSFVAAPLAGIVSVRVARQGEVVQTGAPLPKST